MAITLYEGVIKLAQNVMGARNPEASVLDGNFRYPGEVLERMEEYGYSSIKDYSEVMSALLQIKYELKYPDEKMFVGDQVPVFIKRAEQKAQENHSLLLLYNVIFYQQDPNLDHLIKIAESCTLQEITEFLYKVIISFKRRDDYLSMLKQMISKEEIDKLPSCDIMENKEFFRTFIRLCDKLTDNYQRESLPEYVPIYAALYKEHVKGKKLKQLINMRFTYPDVLQLNFGIWYVSGISTDLSYDSTIKWWRLKKEWFQAMLTQPEELKCPELLEDALTDKMPRKINGTTVTYDFLFDEFHGKVTNQKNSYYLFYLLTTGEAQKTIKDPYMYYQKICPDHPISLDTKQGIAWVREYGTFLEKGKTSYRLWQILSLLIEPYLSDAVLLKEKSGLIEEIFHTDIKQYILKHVNRFDRDKITALLNQGYITLEETYKISPHWTASFLSLFNQVIQVNFLQKYCEDRNWKFTNAEADFLNDCLQSSWPLSLAYFKKTLPTEKLDPGILRNLMGLVIEICTRIPKICDLDDLMAGYIANKETRQVLGEKICEEWYLVLEKRNYTGIKSLQEAYLTEERLSQIRKKEILKEQEEIEEKIQKEVVLLHDRSLSEICKKFPYAWSDKIRSKAVLQILQEHFVGHNAIKKEECVRLYTFLVECYEHDLLTHEQLIKLLSKFTEEKS